MEVPEAMLKKTVRIDGHAYRVLDYDGATKKLKLEVGTIIYVGPLAGKHDEYRYILARDADTTSLNKTVAQQVAIDEHVVLQRQRRIANLASIMQKRQVDEMHRTADRDAADWASTAEARIDSAKRAKK